MKTILILASICLLTLTATAQTEAPPKHHHKGGATNNAANATMTPLGPATRNDPSADLTNQIAFYQKSFVPTDPWRIMNNKTNFAKGADWVQFEGTVVQAGEDGIIIRGWFGKPLTYMLPGYSGNTMFLLSNYPRHVVPGQIVSRNDKLVAFKAGTKGEMENLDYGTVWVPQLTEEQKAHATQAKSQTDARVLAFHEELAAKGDSYGEYKMGLRYEHGDGVDKDLQKARDMLSKAAAQGNKDAADELAKIPSSN